MYSVELRYPLFTPYTPFENQKSHTQLTGDNDFQDGSGQQDDTFTSICNFITGATEKENIPEVTMNALKEGQSKVCAKQIQNAFMAIQSGLKKKGIDIGGFEFHWLDREATLRENEVLRPKELYKDAKDFFEGEK